RRTVAQNLPTSVGRRHEDHRRFAHVDPHGAVFRDVDARRLGQIDHRLVGPELDQVEHHEVDEAGDAVDRQNDEGPGDDRVDELVVGDLAVEVVDPAGQREAAVAARDAEGEGKGEGDAGEAAAKCLHEQ